MHFVSNECYLFALDFDYRPVEILRVFFSTVYEDRKNYKELTKPNDFFQIGSNSNSPIAKNVWKCDALNANYIYWEYKSTKNSKWTKILPPALVRRPSVKSKVNRTIMSIIDDGDESLVTKLKTSTGYFRCVAEQVARNYKVRSSPLRILIPCKHLQIFIPLKIFQLPLWIFIAH